MRDNLGKEALKDSFRKKVEKFDQYFNDHEQFHKIFTELCFVYIEDGCDGFCPECEQMTKCEAYKEKKDGRSFISSVLSVK
jgi:hypothetical protein